MKWTVGVLLVLLPASAWAAGPASSTSPASSPALPPYDWNQVQRAIERAREHLLAVQNADGSWGSGQEADIVTPGVGITLNREARTVPSSKASAWIEKSSTESTKAQALRCMFFHTSNRWTGFRYTRLLDQEAGRLLDNLQAPLFWRILAADAVIKSDSELISSALCRRLQDECIKLQLGGEPRATIESAWMLTVTYGYLSVIGGGAGPPKPLPGLEQAMARAEAAIGRYLRQEDHHAEELAGMLWRIQLLCESTGRWQWDGLDVYRLGARLLLARQQSDGRWGQDDSALATAQAYNFLSAGADRLFLAHLRHGGDWNLYPLAAINACKWASRDGCYGLCGLADVVDAEALLNQTRARVVLITGSRKLELTEAERRAVREFVQRGGMIVSCASGPAFDRSALELYRELFPGCTVSQAGPDHPLYAWCRTYSLPAPTSQFIVLDNGIRPLAVHSAAQLPYAWHYWKIASRRADFDVLYNVWWFSGGRRFNSQRGMENPWPTEPPADAKQTIRLARLDCDANWNAEPLAHERLRRLLGKHEKIRLEIVAPAGPGDLDRLRPDLALLAGTGTLQLRESDAAALRRYVAGGGTLLVESMGGAKAFAESADAEFSRLYGHKALRLLPPDHLLYTQDGHVIRRVGYTVKKRSEIRQRATAAISPAEEDGDGRTLREKLPCLEGIEIDGRVAVIFSPDDITAGLLGREFFDISGYDPDGSAYAIMRNVLLYAARPGGKMSP
ncbi:MAG: hypothetical protein BWX88_01314 [Planctomycetes bacterium ADurb.Bin126]|nr:MAG: hypothetical protein BWX88_01314 [Planctomycetes bacterium ADurb.Bin126]HOD80844.1 DUF4159 domain-containing protein [Phycisphaerae bacterium]HQL74832.1 DUF4159 domain-containing protein [Phycisphaerae bacterium]